MDLSPRDALTTLALFVSAGAFVLGVVNYRRARKLDKRDLFLKIHERLIDPDVVAGRRILYALRSKEQAAALVYREDDMTKVYRALAMFDVLALYAENGWIDEQTVLDEWGHSLRNSVDPAEYFIAARYETVRWHSWPHYQALAAKARAQEPLPA
jgi:hypothetical protein